MFYEFILTTENPLPARQTFRNSSKPLKENNYKKIIYSLSLKVQQTLERDWLKFGAGNPISHSSELQVPWPPL